MVERTCQDAFITVDIAAIDPLLAGRPPTAESLRAFTYVPRRLLPRLYEKYGSENVDRMLNFVMQLLISTFGVANVEALREGCRDVNIPVPNACPPDPVAYATFPFGSPGERSTSDTSILTFTGTVSPPNEDLCSFPSRMEHRANVAARTQLGQTVRSLRTTVESLKDQQETVEVRFGESQWKLNTAASQLRKTEKDLDFNSLVTSKNGLANGIARLQDQVHSLLVDKTNLSDERADFQSRFETAQSLVDHLTEQKLALEYQYDHLAMTFGEYRAGAQGVIDGLRKEGSALRDRERSLIQDLEWTRDEVAELITAVSDEGGPEWIRPPPYNPSPPTSFPAPPVTGVPAIISGADINPIIPTAAS
jgi:hypothetical protein